MAAGESRLGSYDEILEAIVERLIDQVEGCSEANCYLALDPDTLPSNPADHVYVVAPVSGSFRTGAFVGGGLNHLATHAGCKVAIHCPTLIDQKNRDAHAITDEALGIIRKASAVISALSATGDGPNPGGSWAPSRVDYELSSPFTPLGYALFRHENHAVRSIELTFGFEFDWDVTKR